MEVYDPLADAPPPRYAVESDDEDEYNTASSLSTGSEQPSKVNVEVKTTYDIPRRRPLIFASGEAGASWAKITNLSERSAGIYVNDLLVGLVFCSPWTGAVIVVSEAELDHARLPLFAMTTYVTAIINHLQPTSVAILDSYSTQAYISSRAISQDTAPIRYLSIGKKMVLDPQLELFTPPNLLQSTTASLLNALFLRSLREESTGGAVVAILLPSPKIPRPPPVTFNSRGTAGDFTDTSWERETLEIVHKWLFAIVGEAADGSTVRPRIGSAARSTVSAEIARSAFGEVGEGGMYI